MANSTGSRISSGSAEKNPLARRTMTRMQTGDDLTVKPLLPGRLLFSSVGAVRDFMPYPGHIFIAHWAHDTQAPESRDQLSTVGGQPPYSDDLIDHRPGRRASNRGRLSTPASIDLFDASTARKSRLNPFKPLDY